MKIFFSLKIAKVKFLAHPQNQKGNLNLNSLLLYLEQLWRLTKDKKLENKAGKWKYSNNIWSIRNNGTQSEVSFQQTGDVLGFKDDGNGILKVLLHEKSDQQMGEIFLFCFSS